ncbi:MAG: hypothetical protein HRT37_07525 [Alteromonadaceae bacterium]|nr:hypothetical protein [Alteromonadaceae bacterium]
MWQSKTMSLDDVLSDFRKFLLLNFELMSEILSGDDDIQELLDDWLQANWEVIVESRLRYFKLIDGFIDIYGVGADCNGSSSRVSLPDKSPISAIQIKPNYILHSFGTLSNGFFVQEPPFDYVKGENANTDDLILPLHQVTFCIGETYDNLAT